MTLASIAEAAARYRRPEGVVLEYGTAGFRTRATLLDSTFFRMGMLAALRSRALGGLAVGLMVTASHNGAYDNGIKLVDPDGGMLTQAWEKHASAVANAEEGLLAQALQAVALEECFDPHAGEALVMVGRDTREHSMRLSAIATEGATLLGANLQDNALCTTPQLHHCVRFHNGLGGGGGGGDAQWTGEGGYYKMLAEAYLALLRTAPPAPTPSPLWVDAAHGVGAAKLVPLAALLGDALPIEVANEAGAGELNVGCGAEYVQKGRLPPKGWDGRLEVRCPKPPLNSHLPPLTPHLPPTCPLT